MKKVPGHPRLFLRGTTYYHRAAVPKDIKATYPKSEEKKSLETSDFREAIRRVRIEAARVDRAFDEHRRQMARQSEPFLESLTDAQIDLAGQLYLEHLLEEDNETRVDGFYDADEPIPDLPRPDFEEYGERNAAFEDYDRELYARGKVDAFFRSEAEEVLSWEGLDVRLAPDSQSWRILVRRLQEVSILARERIAERHQGRVVPTPRVDVQTAVSTGPLASQVVGEWIKEKSATTWNDKTAREHTTWIGHFLRVIGDKSITEYKKADARRFKTVLSSLPPNWVKHPRLRGMDIEAAAQQADALGLGRMSTTNINKLLNFVRSFFRWAAANYDDVNPDIFKGLQLPKASSAKDERDPFSIDELNTIFRVT